MSRHTSRSATTITNISLGWSLKRFHLRATYSTSKLSKPILCHPKKIRLIFINFPLVKRFSAQRQLYRHLSIQRYSIDIYQYNANPPAILPISLYLRFDVASRSTKQLPRWLYKTTTFILTFYSCDDSWKVLNENVRIFNCLFQGYPNLEMNPLFKALLKYCFHNKQAPGALHKARWMAKILYCLKMVHLQKDITTKFPPGAIFGIGQLQKIYQFVVPVYIYMPRWFTAQIPQEAVANDLNIYRKTLEHSNQVVSTSVIRSFSRHTWCLTEKWSWVTIPLLQKTLILSLNWIRFKKLTILQHDMTQVLKTYSSNCYGYTTTLFICWVINIEFFQTASHQSVFFKITYFTMGRFCNLPTWNQCCKKQ